MVSAMSANAIGSMPPTPMPIRKHISRFQVNPGIAPQIEVLTNSWHAKMIDARRPIRSPSQPQSNEPSTVPPIPTSGSSDTGR